MAFGGRGPVTPDQTPSLLDCRRVSWLFYITQLVPTCCSSPGKLLIQQASPAKEREPGPDLRDTVPAARGLGRQMETGMRSSQALGGAKGTQVLPRGRADPGSCRGVASAGEGRSRSLPGATVPSAPGAQAGTEEGGAGLREPLLWAGVWARPTLQTLLSRKAHRGLQPLPPPTFLGCPQPPVPHGGNKNLPGRSGGGHRPRPGLLQGPAGWHQGTSRPQVAFICFVYP